MFDDPDDHPGEIFDDDLCEWLPEDRVERWHKLKALRMVYQAWGEEWRWAADTCWQTLKALEDDDREALDGWLSHFTLDEVVAWRARLE